MSGDVSKTRGYPSLLATLALIFVMHAFVPGSEIVQIAGVNVILLFVLAATIRSVAQDRRAVAAGIGLAVTAYAFSWLQVAVTDPWVAVVTYAAYVVFFAVTGVVILGDVFSHGRVDAAHVAGAICVYMLIGVIGGFLFALIATVDPDAIAISETAASPHKPLNTFFYYSFVTLSTVGYGDIVPVSKVARSLATMIAVIGQVYLAVLVAALVSRSISDRKRDDAGPEG